MALVYVKAKPGHLIAPPKRVRKNPSEDWTAAQDALMLHLGQPAYLQAGEWALYEVLGGEYGVDDLEIDRIVDDYEFYEQSYWDKLEKKYPGVSERVSEHVCTKSFEYGDMMGLPATCVFSDPEKVHPGTWLIHFSPASFHSFDRGAALDALAYTGQNETEHAEKDGPWVFAFAFEIPDMDRSFESIRRRLTGYSAKYGRNFLVFQCDHAVSAHHSGDQETQVIFPLGSEYNVINATRGTLAPTNKAVKEVLEREEAGEELTDEDEDILRGEILFSTVEELEELIENGLVEPDDFDNYRG